MAEDLSKPIMRDANAGWNIKRQTTRAGLASLGHSRWFREATMVELQLEIGGLNIHQGGYQFPRELGGARSGQKRSRQREPKPKQRERCKCGSTDHERTSHKDCELNKANSVAEASV